MAPEWIIIVSPSALQFEFVKLTDSQCNYAIESYHLNSYSLLCRLAGLKQRCLSRLSVAAVSWKPWMSVIALRYFFDMGLFVKP